MEEKKECQRLLMLEWAMAKAESDNVTLVGAHAADAARKPFKPPKPACADESPSLHVDGGSQPIPEDDKDTVSYLQGGNRPTLSVLETDAKRQRCDEAPMSQEWPEFEQYDTSFRC